METLPPPIPAPVPPQRFVLSDGARAVAFGRGLAVALPAGLAAGAFGSLTVSPRVAGNFQLRASCAAPSPGGIRWSCAAWFDGSHAACEPELALPATGLRSTPFHDRWDTLCEDEPCERRAELSRLATTKPSAAVVAPILRDLVLEMRDVLTRACARGHCDAKIAAAARDAFDATLVAIERARIRVERVRRRIDVPVAGHRSARVRYMAFKATVGDATLACGGLKADDPWASCTALVDSRFDLTPDASVPTGHAIRFISNNEWGYGNIVETADGFILSGSIFTRTPQQGEGSP